MSTQITIVTVDGRVIHGINYSVDPGMLPSDPVSLAAGMQGGMAYGVYHLHDAHGWVYIPASQISSVTQIQPGAPT